jgi:hypothetical protein
LIYFRENFPVEAARHASMIFRVTRIARIARTAAAFCIRRVRVGRCLEAIARQEKTTSASSDPIRRRHMVPT